MNIDKESFKNYINQKYPEKFRIYEIESITIKTSRYYSNSFRLDSIYYTEALEKGYVDLTMICPTWSGWKSQDKKFISKINHHQYGDAWFTYKSKNSSNRFNIVFYIEWLRSSKLNSIGI